MTVLETVREFAAEQLTPEQRDELARRHAIYHLTLAARAEAFLGGEAQTVWLERLEREHDNLRAVIRWSLEQEPDLRGALSEDTTGTGGPGGDCRNAGLPG
jgi:predicted ATPase